MGRLQTKSGLNYQVVRWRMLVSCFFGYFDDKFDGVFALLISLFLEYIANLLIYFDEFGEELLLVGVGLIKDKDLLHLNLPILPTDEGYGFEGSQEQKFALLRSVPTKTEVIEDIYFFGLEYCLKL